MTATLHDYLLERGVPAISGIDTRALTRRLRSAGVMMGCLVQDEDPAEALARLLAAPRYGVSDLVPSVSAERPFAWPPAGVYAPVDGDGDYSCISTTVVTPSSRIVSTIAKAMRAIGSPCGSPG